MSRPTWVPAAQWATLLQTAAAYDSYPEVYAAIGWWETRWGQAGAGRQGYILGVGVPGSGAVQTQYQGLAAQLAWTAPRVQPVIDRRPSLATFLTYAEQVQKPHNPAAWGKGVWSVYRGLGPPTVPPASGGGSGTSGGSSGAPPATPGSGSAGPAWPLWLAVAGGGIVGLWLLTR